MFWQDRSPDALLLREAEEAATSESHHMRSVAFSTHCCGEGPFECCVVCPSGEGCVAVFVSRSGEVGVSCVEETVAVKPVMEGDWVGQRVSESEETVRETVGGGGGV